MLMKVAAVLVLLLVGFSQWGMPGGVGDWVAALVVKTVLLLVAALVCAVGAAVAFARQDVPS